MNRNELIELLALPEQSQESLALRQQANLFSHQRFNDQSLLLGQIGIERHACSAACKFCSFSEEFFTDTPIKLNQERLLPQIANFCASGQVKVLFLLSMHDCHMRKLCQLVEAAREVIPSSTQLVVNIGDAKLARWQELKSAGISGAYHVLRLGEGVDTRLQAQERRETIAAIRQCELDWYYCCEPIGPEHSNEALADAILLGNEFGCYQHAAMARVNFAGSPFSSLGEISKERLAQIVAAITLASAGNPELRSIAVHEPDPLSLRSGANSIYAECGVNPRDLAADTALGRGGNVASMDAMLREAGWRV